ncbi:MAG: metal ABC transporter solute-binding protein, Zn/Mn family [Marinifilaceae bacterium]
MSKITYWSVLLLIVTGFCSCKFDSKAKKENLVTVSILPQKYFVERIAGQDFQVNVLIPPGASPATYEPTPAQMQNIAHSKVYFRIGHIPFEKAWMKKLLAGTKDLLVVDLSKGIELVRGPEVRHGDHFHEGGIDPHTWTSPLVVKKMAAGILEVLTEMKPEKKEEYLDNYKHFAAELDRLDRDAKEAFSGMQNKAFMIYHPAMSYFARDYGLHQVPIELEGKDPTPAYLKHVIANARELNIHVIFVQKQFSTENAQAVAREINGEVQAIDPLSEDWLKEMQRIVKVFQSSLNH